MNRSAFFGFALLIVPAVSWAGAPVMEAGDAVVFATRDGGGLVLSLNDDPKIRFIETKGETLALRVIPLDRTSEEIGSGRIILLKPLEQREMRLRDEFAEEALAETKLRVEALDGRGQMTVTSTQLLADSSTVRRRAVSPPKPRPPSFTLIDQAEASGAIDSETALLYRVYSLFADARLPAQYRGDDSGVPDSLYMAEVRERFPTLSPATQAAVQPFLIPPAYKDSWVNTKAGGAVTTLATRPPCESLSDKWVGVLSSNNFVEVWYRSDLAGDAETARKVAAE